MPSYWYNLHECRVKEDDNEEVAKQKEFNFKIAAAKKPYFMTYIYPKLKSENDTYIRNNNRDSIRKFNKYGIKDINDLENYKAKTSSMVDYLNHYYKKLPVGNNPCVVNQISWIFENAFKKNRVDKRHPAFDYSILKCGTEYSKEDYKKISLLYKEYNNEIEKLRINSWNKKVNKDDIFDSQLSLKLFFQGECEKICPNEEELCDIVLDICYSRERSKQFAWEICGSMILNNLLKYNNYKIHYPQMVEDNGDFTYCGMQFKMCEKEIGGEN